MKTKSTEEFEKLLLKVINASHECGAHDGTLDEYSVLFQQANLANEALREHVKAIREEALREAAALAQSRKYNGVDSYGHAFVEGCHTVASDILSLISTKEKP